MMHAATAESRARFSSELPPMIHEVPLPETVDNSAAVVGWRMKRRMDAALLSRIAAAWARKGVARAGRVGGGITPNPFL
jgi:hypothetical protein